MPNKSPFDTPYTGRSGNNETGLFAYDIYVTLKFKIGIDGENQMRYAYIEDMYCILYEYTWPQHVMYAWTRSARNVSMIQLARALNGNIILMKFSSLAAWEVAFRCNR